MRNRLPALPPGSRDSAVPPLQVASLERTLRGPAGTLALLPRATEAMKFVIFGLTISSSWGNDHATLWRGLFPREGPRALLDAVGRTAC